MRAGYLVGFVLCIAAMLWTVCCPSMLWGKQRDPSPSIRELTGEVMYPTTTRPPFATPPTHGAKKNPLLYSFPPARQPTRPRPRWHTTLYTPTFVTRIEGVWFIVDCWHHRVLYHTDFTQPIEEWRALDPAEEGALGEEERTRKGLMHAHMRIPHSVAYDGSNKHYAVESSNGGSDGLNHSILFYTKHQGAEGSVPTFECIQEVHVCHTQNARRPHRLIYDSQFTKAFFVYLTKPAHISKFVLGPDGKWIRQFCVPLPFMKGSYARSIYVHIDGLMYITSGPRGIWAVDHKGSSGVTPLKFYSVRALGMKIMNDLLFHKNWWYATSTTPCVFKRFRSLQTMEQHEDLSGLLGLCRADRGGMSTGTPYFLQVVDDALYVPYIFSRSGVASLDLSRNATRLRKEDVTHHFKKGGWTETPEDIEIRNLGW